MAQPEVGGELHGRDLVDVLLELVEEVVPAADQLALVLVGHQVQLVVLPGLPNLKSVNVIKQGYLTAIIIKAGFVTVMAMVILL